MNKFTAFLNRVNSASGEAQIFSYAFWGVIVAGVLWDYCDGCLPNELLALWGAVSGLALVSSIYMSKRATESLLWLDMAIGMVVLSIYALHEPHYVSTMVYNVKADGTFIKLDHSITEWFTMVMLVWMAAHCAYLANLLHRQQLEERRFKDEL